MTAPRGSLLHPLELLLLASAAASAAWTLDWRPLAVGVLAELAWRVLRPVHDRRMARTARATRVDEGEQARVRLLTEPLRRRFLELDRTRADIRRLAAGNPAWSSVGIEGELAKVDALVDAWLGLAASTSQRAAIVRGGVARDADAPSEARADALDALERSEAELEAVERALGDTRDRVAAMASPASLAESVDALLAGVGAAERALRDVEALEPTRAARSGRTRAPAGPGS